MVKEAISAFRVLAKEVRNVDVAVNQAYAGCAQPAQWRFNINGKFSYLCPAAFGSLFPHVFFDMQNDLAAGANKVVSCPDHKVNLRFRFIADPQSDHCASCGCYDFAPIKIQIVDRTGTQTELSLTDILKATHFKCFSAFQVLFPYYFALVNGGSLGFYTNDRGSAIVQCPNSEKKIEFHVLQDGRGDIHYRVVGCGQECPLGYRKDETHRIAPHPAVPLYVLYVAYLYSVYMLRDSHAREMVLKDPLGDDGMVYRLVKQGSEAK